MKIIDYALAIAASEDNFMSMVSSLMRKGWQPLGGIAMVQTDEHEIYFAQAMVKYEGKGW